MVRTAEAQTLGVDIFEQLRAAVLEGKYRPGERLKPVELCAEYGVSPGVLREAVMRLAEQRLATVEHNRGYRVTTISADQIRELVEVRRINEGAALRLSMARGTASWEGEVLAAHHRLKSITSLAQADPAAWTVGHRDYHMALLSACGNRRLLEVCDDLFTASELYRRWSGNLQAVTPARRPKRRDQDTEHAQILKAVLDRDTERAVRLYEEHLNRTADLALLYADSSTVKA